ncbi:LOW QUALITY PROTEIN: hypothetical protein OSB04_016067 [Centaurea solstitialis]|uniref:TIR domain-containing protein n=1 Tax=Centaurea solstitialis TaxID=347529 RepID=A0AA38W841_9ASTR|nr:LOW QUALITY PROTEIN: hypothetical protein OSB04_016067 [Centaurea solstitialis]
MNHEFKGSIVVLSENYATLSWCLEELWLILQQSRESNHFEAIWHIQHRSQIFFKTKGNLKRWTEALTDITHLSALVFYGWRDVKIRAFDDANRRTYVDLKNKWKTLVHTASIAPHQRRGEPVPQDILDRVLAAHAYWSQQHTKHQSARAFDLDASDDVTVTFDEDYHTKILRKGKGSKRLEGLDMRRLHEEGATSKI